MKHWHKIFAVCALMAFAATQAAFAQSKAKPASPCDKHKVTGPDETGSEEESGSNAVATSQRVDLGLSVYWAGYNLGASTPEGSGSMYAWEDAKSEAASRWGGSWRLPTKAEMDELKRKCRCRWSTYKGKGGYLVTGPNGNTIFLPAAGFRYGSSLQSANAMGCYWASTYNEDEEKGYNMYFDKEGMNSSYIDISMGYSVRPVSNK